MINAHPSPDSSLCSMANDIAHLMNLQNSMRFAESLSQFLRKHVVFDDSMYLFSYKGKPISALSCYGNTRKYAHLLKDVYFDGIYLLDPLIEEVQNSPKTNGLHWSGDFWPVNFYSSEFYNSFLHYIDIGEDLIYVFGNTDGYAVTFAFGRFRDSDSYTDEEKDCLKKIEPLIGTLMLNNLDFLTNHIQRQTCASELKQSVECAMDRFGNSVLTPREKELALLLLRGHSNKSAAGKMGIAIDTVKMHRKNLHRKLDIRSHSELFSLFIQSILHVSRKPQADPLEGIMFKTAKSENADFSLSPMRIGAF